MMEMAMVEAVRAAQAPQSVSYLNERLAVEKVADPEAVARFAEAMGILEREGLPRRQYQGVAEVFKKTGMVSSPSEERIRFMDALAQDLSRTLSQIEGVVDARVHVVLPENDPFARNVKPSSAAVSIRHRYDVDMADYVPQIKALVRNSIEGLDYGKISVTLFRDAPPRKR